jgi:hypothetical protein
MRFATWADGLATCLGPGDDLDGNVCLYLSMS